LTFTGRLLPIKGAHLLHFGFATTDEIATELARRLRAQRLAQNLQQSELAARAGISEKTVRTFERTGRASLDVFLRIVSALGLADSLSDLFELKAKSIRDMELAAQKRIRAGRRRR
jgi:transcriptional regulator with XRE-family HTH domain